MKEKMMLILLICVFSIALLPQNKEAQKMYLTASKLVRENNLIEATKILNQILEQYPEDTISIKADELLNKITEKREMKGVTDSPTIWMDVTYHNSRRPWQRYNHEPLTVFHFFHGFDFNNHRFPISEAIPIYRNKNEILPTTLSGFKTGVYVNKGNDSDSGLQSEKEFNVLLRCDTNNEEGKHFTLVRNQNIQFDNDGWDFLRDHYNFDVYHLGSVQDEFKHQILLKVNNPSFNRIQLSVNHLLLCELFQNTYVIPAPTHHSEKIIDFNHQLKSRALSMLEKLLKMDITNNYQVFDDRFQRDKYRNEVPVVQEKVYKDQFIIASGLHEYNDYVKRALRRTRNRISSTNPSADRSKSTLNVLWIVGDHGYKKWVPIGTNHRNETLPILLRRGENYTIYVLQAEAITYEYFCYLTIGNASVYHLFVSPKEQNMLTYDLDFITQPGMHHSYPKLALLQSNGIEEHSLSEALLQKKIDLNLEYFIFGEHNLEFIFDTLINQDLELILKSKMESLAVALGGNP